MPIQMTMEEYEQHVDQNDGVCLACGGWAGFCEPDAREYPCDACGEKKVFGCEEAFMMGELVLDEEG